MLGPLEMSSSVGKEILAPKTTVDLTGVAIPTVNLGDLLTSAPLDHEAFS